MSRPGDLRSTRNCDRPWWRSLSLAGLVRHSAIMKCALCALLVQILRPLMRVAALDRHRLGADRGEVGARCRARSCRCRNSTRPRRCAAGSLRAAPRCRSAGSAARSGGRRPNARRPARPPRAFPRSRRSVRAKLRSWPPYFFGQVMPIQPRSPRRRLNSGEWLPAKSLLGPQLPAARSVDEKCAHFAAQRLAFRRQGQRIETEHVAHGSPLPSFFCPMVMTGRRRVK